MDQRLARRDQLEAPGRRSRRACSRPRSARRSSRPDRWRCASSGRTARPRADACRRSRPCRTSCARPECRSLRRARAARRSASEMWMPPPTSSSGRSALAMSAAARSSSCGSGRRAARLRLAACARRPRNPPRRNRARRGRRPPARRARPAPAVPRSRPRRRGAPARGCACVASTRISSLHGGLQDFDLPRLLRHVLPGVIAVGVADDRDLRHAGVERLDQRGDEIGRAGPERRVAHARRGWSRAHRRRRRTRRSARR